MDVFEHNVMLLAIGAVVGAIGWHYVHAKVAADIAALKTDVSTLKAQAQAGIAAAGTAVTAVTGAAAATPAKPAA
jgi:hypothetical protein